MSEGKKCQTKDMSKRKSRPGQRIAGGFKKVSDLAEKLSEAVREVEDHIDDDKDSIVLFEVEKGKPVVIVAGPDGKMGAEGFRTAVARFCNEEDIPELEIWAKAFKQASRKLETMIRRIRKDPKKYIMPDR